MPEMPEVETIRRIIAPQLVGQEIMSVKINNPQVIAYPAEVVFREQLVGQSVGSLSRRGKFLTIHFVNGDRLVLHLRMTGQVLVMPADAPLEKHTHLVMELSGGEQLRYIDVRRFGRFWYVQSGEKDTLSGQDKLGLEPLSESLSVAYLMAKAATRRRAIKEVLHDQSVVAGIGNIYSDEILYEAGIYPGQRCLDLSADDWQRLADKIKEVIAWGIRTNEMTPAEYLSGKGKEYRNTSQLRVYGREGQPCRHCQAVMERMVISGRSSCYCPVCQKEKT